MTYIYRCRQCGLVVESKVNRDPEPCPRCEARELMRDWRAEAANVIPPKP